MDLVTIWGQVTSASLHPFHPGCWPCLRLRFKGNAGEAPKQIAVPKGVETIAGTNFLDNSHTLPTNILNISLLGNVEHNSKKRIKFLRWDQNAGWVESGIHRLVLTFLFGWFGLWFATRSTRILDSTLVKPTKKWGDELKPPEMTQPVIYKNIFNLAQTPKKWLIFVGTSWKFRPLVFCTFCLSCIKTQEFQWICSCFF